MNAKHLVVMAAGTGGHVVPGIAVAREMQRRGWSVSWLGTKTGMENRLVPPTGIALDSIGFAGLRGKGALGMATGGVRLLKAFAECVGVLRRRRADAVLGMGGYVCFPGGLMASALSRPLVLVNADAALLLSNRGLLPVADRVAFGFDSDAARATKNAVVTGNRRERRLERLLSPSPTDNRITFGCINVPENFYRQRVLAHFQRSGGVVYVMPDTKPLETVFPRVASFIAANP